MKLINLCCFLLCNVALVPAASIPATLQLLKNDTFPHITPGFRIDNVSSLAFTPLQGLEMKFTWDHDVELSVTEVFINTIEAMNAIAQVPWNAFITSEQEVVFPQFKSRLIFGSFRQKLQAKHLISGVYRTGLAMACATTKDKLYAGILMGTSPIGWIRYEMRPPRQEDVSVNSTFLIDANYSTKIVSTGLSKQSPTSLLNPTSFPRSGRVKDPDDPNFSIQYELQGPFVNQARMFTAFTDGIATAAQYGNDETGAFLTVYSWDRVVCIVIRKDNEKVTLKWGAVKSALRVIWGEIIIGYRRQAQEIFEDMIFELYYGDDQRFGEGYIVSRTASSTPDPAVAIAKRESVDLAIPMCSFSSAQLDRSIM